MNILLDSLALLWWLSDDAKLGNAARSYISNQEHAVYYSEASLWEAKVKQSSGLLTIDGDLLATLQLEPFQFLGVTSEHRHHCAAIPATLKDTFARFLIAQCQIEDMTLISHDKRLAIYGVPIIESQR